MRQHNVRVRLINANFTKMFYGGAISSLGDFIFDTTLILWIGTKLLAGKSYAPAAVSGVLVAVAIGTIVIGPAAGVFTDRWDRRRTMLVSDLIRAVLIGGLAVVVMLPGGTVPVGVTLGLTYGVVLISTGVSQFFSSARFTLVSDVIGDDGDRAKAAGWSQSAGYTAAIVGPPLAAPLLFTTGVYWAMIINAASFVVSFLLIRAVRLPALVTANPAEVEPADVVSQDAITPVTIGVEAEMEQLATTPEPEVKPGFVQDFVTGLRFIMKSQVMRVVMISVTVATLASGALNALLVFFVSGNLHANAHWFGTLGMGEGIGAVAGALLAAWICRKFGDTRVFCLALIAVGILMIVFARLGNIVAAVAVLGITGIPLGALNVALTPLLLRSVPREVLGRVGGVLNPVQQVASMGSALLCGWLVSTVMRNFHHTVAGFTFGRIDTIFTIGGVLIALGGVYATIGLRGAGAGGSDPATRVVHEPSEVASAT